jgi:hypothetical protein
LAESHKGFELISFDMPWEEFGQWLRRVQRLGFSNLALRVHIACLYVQSLHLFPRRAREAWEMLEDAERRVLRIRKEHLHLPEQPPPQAPARGPPQQALWA